MKSLDETERLALIQVVTESIHYSEIMRVMPQPGLESALEKLQAASPEAVQEYADNLNKKMGRSRGND